MNFFKKTIALSALAATAVFGGRAEGWPANYEGVMLQGFFWDSYSETRWSNLTSQADEMSQYFDLIWIPNSANCGGSRQMGYSPIYWFSNYRSSFGNENTLRTMIQTYKDHGVGIIGDVVINHRNGVSSWTDFPTETWNGQEWHIGLDGICRNDEVANQAGQPKPTGAKDTGENFDGARDLDHTNANVQENCKAYCKFLIDDLGLAGFRLDMVKGYGGQYTKIYNQYSKPQFCVGEYFDGSYDKVAAWIESTGRESAAFDFPAKFAINSAFSGDLSKLVWLATGTNPQPAGMMHYGYPQYSVTFIDNHDTYRDNNKFNGNVVAANAFILFSPGTPCIFLAHWIDYKDQLKPLIAARKEVGVCNTSRVTVLKYTSSCYMAEIIGTKGRAAVRIGNTSDVPAGYTSANIKAQGTGYCVWTRNDGGETPDLPDNPSAAPARLYLMGHLPEGHWQTDVAVAMEKDGDKFTAENVTIEDAGGTAHLGYFSFVTSIGASWDVVNASDRYGADSHDALIKAGETKQVEKFTAGASASSAYSWAIAPGTYDFTVDFSNMTLAVKEHSGVADIEADDNAEAVYYNLQGVCVARGNAPTAPGIYISRRGTKVEKVVIR